MESKSITYLAYHSSPSHIHECPISDEHRPARAMQEHKTESASGAVDIEGGRESQNRQAIRAQSLALSRIPDGDHKYIEEHNDSGDQWVASGGGGGREATTAGQRVASAARIRRPLQGRPRGT